MSSSRKSDKLLVPTKQLWSCPWFHAEIGFVYAISDKLMWWAMVTRMSEPEFLHALLMSHGSDYPLGPLAQHLSSPEDKGQAHFADMYLLLSERFDRITTRTCLSSEELLRASRSDPKDWKKYWDHKDQCVGSCVNQLQFLQLVSANLDQHLRLELT